MGETPADDEPDGVGVRHDPPAAPTHEGQRHKTSLAMMFKLAQAAEKRWRRLNGHEQLELLLQGKVFVDGVPRDAA